MDGVTPPPDPREFVLVRRTDMECVVAFAGPCALTRFQQEAFAAFNAALAAEPGEVWYRATRISDGRTVRMDQNPYPRQFLKDGEVGQYREDKVVVFPLPLPAKEPKP